MPKYNVAVPVVEVLDALDEADAIRVLQRRLDRAGFQTYEGPLELGPHAFESEPVDWRDGHWAYQPLGKEVDES